MSGVRVNLTDLDPDPMWTRMLLIGTWKPMSDDEVDAFAEG
jgi:hypothetical protein